MSGYNKVCHEGDTLTTATIPGGGASQALETSVLSYELACHYMFIHVMYVHASMYRVLGQCLSAIELGCRGNGRKSCSGPTCDCIES